MQPVSITVTLHETRQLPDGSIDLPASDDFIAALMPADGLMTKLRGIVLNGCDTIALAKSITLRFPNLLVVCWQSLADDAAARTFMAGFYGALASDLAADTKIDIESAFAAGLAAFQSQGFKYGDPSIYLHPQGHPHLLEPCFGRCQGCSPPVHGQPALVCCVDGHVHVKDPLIGWLVAGVTEAARRQPGSFDEL